MMPKPASSWFAPVHQCEAHLTRYRRDRAYHASLAALKRRDPLYERTMEIMEKLMGDLPEVVKELAMPTAGAHRAA